MKTSQFTFSAFAILNAAYGLPSRDASIESSLAKRDLPYPLEDYEYCLDNDFEKSFSDITPWGGVKCSRNREIMFYATQVTSGWQSGFDCYKYGKEGLREKIKGGDLQAKEEVCANWLSCCEVGVKTMPYPTNEYVDCLNKELKESAFDNNSWNEVTCPNGKIKYTINGNFWNSAKDCFQAVAQDLKDKIFNGDPYAYQTTEAVFASCTIAVHTEY